MVFNRCGQYKHQKPLCGPQKFNLALGNVKVLLILSMPEINFAVEMFSTHALYYGCPR
jgi:hypothetical protein